MEEDVEVLFQVGVAVGVVGEETHPRQIVFCSFVQARCQGVGLCIAPGGEAAPTPGIEPILAVSGGVNVDGDENDIVFAELAAPGVDAAAALLQGDVFLFWNEEFGVIALGDQGRDDAAGDVAGYLFFPESGVRLGFDVLGATSVAVPEAAVDEDDGAVLGQDEVARSGTAAPGRLWPLGAVGDKPARVCGRLVRPQSCSEGWH